MGFLGGLWRIIMTAVVVIPKLWPVLKQLFGMALDAWARRRVGAKRDQELKDAAKNAEESGDTTELEKLIGSGSSVVTASVAKVETPLNIAGEPGPSSLVDPDITQLIEIPEEKKSPELDNPSHLEIPGWLISSAKVAGAGLGLAIISAMMSKKESKAASMGFGGSQSGVIQDAATDIKNYTYYRGGGRMGSKLLPVFLLFILLSGCASELLDRNAPSFNPKLYAANYKSQSIIRRRGEDEIRCNQPGFNEFVALRYDQLLCLQKIIDSCERFGPEPLICDHQ